MVLKGQAEEGVVLDSLVEHHVEVVKPVLSGLEVVDHLLEVATVDVSHRLVLPLQASDRIFGHMHLLLKCVDCLPQELILKLALQLLGVVECQPVTPSKEHVFVCLGPGLAFLFDVASFDLFHAEELGGQLLSALSNVFKVLPSLALPRVRFQLELQIVGLDLDPELISQPFFVLDSQVHLVEAVARAHSGG